MRLQSRPKKLTHVHHRVPVAQWLEHPTRTRRVVGSNPIWGSDFFRVSPDLYVMYLIIIIIIIIIIMETLFSLFFMAFYNSESR